MLCHGVRRVSLLAIMTMFLGILAIGATPLTPASADQALCVRPAEYGEWQNVDPQTRSMAKVVVGLVCNDVILCDENGNCTGGETYVTLRPFGACTPTPCDWGVSRADPMHDGWLRSIHNFGFKTSYVWVKSYQYSGVTYLRLWVHNDFAPSDGRADYTTDEWMLPR